jgi:hypothetical protein
MTPQEIIERNKEIVLMLGLNHDEEAFVFDGQAYSWDLPRFYSDWNYIMDVVGFIKQNLRTSHNTVGAKVGEYFIDEWTFGVKTYYIRLIQWTDKGWRMTDRENHDLSIYYIIGENCQSEKEAIFLAVSDFAKLYNNKL